MAFPAITFSLTACSVNPSGAITWTLPEAKSASQSARRRNAGEGATPVQVGVGLLFMNRTSRAVGVIAQPADPALWAGRRGRAAAALGGPRQCPPSRGRG